MNVWWPLEQALVAGAQLAWHALQILNRRIPQREPFSRPGRRRRCSRAASAPSPHARLAAHDRLALPDLREGSARRDPLRRAVDSSTLIDEQAGEIKAQIVERDGKIVMEKTCPSTAPSPT